MNILLVYPEFPDTFWGFKHALEFVGKKAALPPLGLLTVAALLPPEWNKRLVDLNVRSLTDRDLAWADCAFVSAMTVQQASARKAMARCRQAGLTVVAKPLLYGHPGSTSRGGPFCPERGRVDVAPFPGRPGGGPGPARLRRRLARELDGLRNEVQRELDGQT
jgi:hypothetical protein